MWALFVVLNQTHRLDGLLQALRCRGVDNLTVMHSASYEAALLGTGWRSRAALRWLPGRQLVHTDTVFTLLADEVEMNRAVEAVEGVLDSGGPEAGFVFVLPVALARGLGGHEDR